MFASNPHGSLGKQASPLEQPFKGANQRSALIRRDSVKNAGIPYWLQAVRSWVRLLAIFTTRFLYNLIVYPVRLRHSPHFRLDTIFSSPPVRRVVHVTNNITSGSGSLPVILTWVSSLSECLVLWSSLSICCIPVCSPCSKTARPIFSEPS